MLYTKVNSTDLRYVLTIITVKNTDIFIVILVIVW